MRCPSCVHQCTIHRTQLSAMLCRYSTAAIAVLHFSHEQQLLSNAFQYIIFQVIGQIFKKNLLKP